MFDRGVLMMLPDSMWFESGRVRSGVLACNGREGCSWDFKALSVFKMLSMCRLKGVSNAEDKITLQEPKGVVGVGALIQGP
jgi:hypothetical protein